MTDVIGVARPRLDAPEKVTGQTRYAADGYVHGLLHARLVLSTEAHALIERINGADALEIPGVVAVLTAADLPTATQGTDRTAEPLAREEVIFAGQPVAMVVAETEAAAEDGAEARVRRLRAAGGRRRRRGGHGAGRLPREACGGGNRQRRSRVDPRRRRADGEHDDEQEQLSGNVLDRVHRSHGDAAAAIRRRATPSSRGRSGRRGSTRRTSSRRRRPRGSSRTARSSSRSRPRAPSSAARELARAYGLPLDKIRIIAEPLGGAFGGKFALVEPLAGGAALALRRPVRLVMTRQEDFAATNPASAQVTELEIGARKDGTLTGFAARMIVDRGSNAGWGVEGITSLLVDRPVPLGRDGTSAATACRRTGSRSAPIAARELRPPPSPSSRCIDELAAELGLDPLELRLQERLRRGRPRHDGAGADLRRGRGARGDGRVTSSGRARARFPRTKASASPSATGPAATSRPRPSAASTPTAR